MTTSSKDTTQENSKTSLVGEDTETSSSAKMRVKKSNKGKVNNKSDAATASSISALHVEADVETTNNNNSDKKESNGCVGESVQQDKADDVSKVVEKERPKLADGFFEIEAVRRKRVRKGEVQYLIKWRGWPETSNTWEPVANLQSCSDILDAFEESLHSGKQKKRKRKHKDGIIQALVKKKQQQSSAKVIPKRRGHTLGSANELSIIDHAAAQYTGSALERPSDAGFLNNEMIRARHYTEERRDYVRHETLPKMPEQNGYENLSSGGGVTKDNGAEPGPSTLFKGSRRRKPKSVKRFRLDPASNGNVSIGAGSTIDRRGSVAPGSVVASQRTAELRNASTVTEIIRPFSFTASVSNNVQDIEVKFMARRSDGAEVVVDNKYLKDHNPLLLISFYESHLKYSPTIPI